VGTGNAGDAFRALGQPARLALLAVIVFGLAPAGAGLASTAPRGRPAAVALLGLRRPPLGPSRSWLERIAGDRIPGAPAVRMAAPGLFAPVNSPVRLVFSEPMDPASVERSFSVQPAAAGSLAWQDPTTLVFEPSQPLAYRTVYRVAVAGKVAQGWLATGGSFTFTTVWEPPAAPAPITLTFDDCGTPEEIQAILYVLAERGLQAIFSQTGMCRDQYPWLVPALVAAGHRVCNHTYSHPVLPRLSDAAVASEIQRGVTIDCDLFRPPYGALDRTGRIARIAASLGYRIQLWDVDTRDWAGTPADAMVAMIHARGGVVLFHMHGIHTVEALTKL